MRASLSVLAALGFAAVAFPLAPAGAHSASACEPPYDFPSAAIWNLPAGVSRSFYLPPRTFGSLVLFGALDVTMYEYASCAIDESCHHHAIVGPMACGNVRASMIELRNENAQSVVVAMAIGQCGQETTCALL